MSVILDEAFKVLVGTATLKHHLNVVLVLSQIGWVLLHCDHSSGLDEWILWELLWRIQCDSLVGIEALCEIISINDSEHSAVDVEVDSNVKVSP